MQRHGLRGFSLAEMLVVVAVIGLMVATAVPSFHSMRRRTAVRAAAGEIRSIFHTARMRAIARGSNTGLKFWQSGPAWSFAMYDDGDGDGVRNDDIASGTDRRTGAVRTLLAQTAFARIGLPPNIPVRDPDGEMLAAGSSPVRFGNSSICAFSRGGESTSGTIYITDDAGVLWAVRVFGATARIRSLRYDFAARKWRDQ